MRAPDLVSPPPSSGLPSGNAAPSTSATDYTKLGRILLAMLISASVLSWLFLQADAINSADHQAYARELRAMRQTDAELDAALLANRVGVQTDFDAIVASISMLTAISGKLGEVPDFLPDEDRQRVMANVSDFRGALQQKIDRIDLFKREFSVLRNSLAFLPIAADLLVDDPGAAIAHTRPVGIFVRGVMTYAHNGSPELAASLGRRLPALDAMTGALAEPHRERLNSVVLHGRIVLQRKPVLDALTREILESPTSTLSELITQHYARGYEQATRRAHNFRVVLYLLALALSGYLALATFRLGRTSHELGQVNRDLEDRIEVLQRTRDELKLYATVFARAAEGMLITDGRARIIAVNPAFTAITGYSAAEILDRSPAILSSGRQSQAFYRDMWRTLERRGQWQGEIWNRRKNGEVYPEWLSITAVRDSGSAASHYIAVFSDTTERKNAEATIQHLAHHDPLTGLPNRLLLQDRLNRAMLQSRRVGSHTAVLLLNLDRFKTINDTLGHDLGDALLQQVARRCQTQLQDIDTVARTSSDEFVLILPDIDHPQDAAAVARKLLVSLGLPYKLGEHDITVTASIGIAIFDGDGGTVAELLRNADAAMHRAKSDGRNNFQFYAADMNTMSLGDLLLENQLRGALDRGELELHYQPKVCASTGALMGAEALLRWRHPELGLIAPGRFVPVAEESGLIVPIGEWVLQEACRQLQIWRDAGRQPVPVAVNLSAQQFGQGNLPALVGEVLSWNRVPAALLELELTETMLMRDVDRTIDMLTKLRGMGVGLSIDDFGTGYSSLAYLKQFRVNVLKIDRSFVHDIHREDTDGKIAAAVIALAHSLGMEVVAEGVETDEQREFLLAHGCDQFQGYLFGRPVPAAEFEQQLATHPRLPCPLPQSA